MNWPEGGKAGGEGMVDGGLSDSGLNRRRVWLLCFEILFCWVEECKNQVKH